MWDEMYGSAQAAEYWDDVVRKVFRAIIGQCRRFWTFWGE